MCSWRRPSRTAGSNQPSTSCLQAPRPCPTFAAGSRSLLPSASVARGGGVISRTAASPMSISAGHASRSMARRYSLGVTSISPTCGRNWPRLSSHPSHFVCYRYTASLRPPPHNLHHQQSRRRPPRLNHHRRRPVRHNLHELVVNLPRRPEYSHLLGRHTDNRS